MAALLLVATRDCSDVPASVQIDLHHAMSSALRAVFVFGLLLFSITFGCIACTSARIIADARLAGPPDSGRRRVHRISSV
jgi:hypothetical protein